MLDDFPGKAGKMQWQKKVYARAYWKWLRTFLLPASGFILMGVLVVQNMLGRGPAGTCAPCLSPGNVKSASSRGVVETSGRNQHDYYFGECESHCDSLLRLFGNVPRYVSRRTSACVAFVPTRGFCFKPMQADDPSLILRRASKLEGYPGEARKFFTQVYKSLPEKASGLAMFMSSDSGDAIPDTVLDLMWDAKTPCVTHSIRKRKTKNFLFMPDYHFMKSRGFSLFMKKTKSASLSFIEKKPSVFWRGSTTGSSKECRSGRSTSSNASHPCESLPRVRLVREALEIPALNARISRAVACCEDYRHALLAKGLHGETRRAEEWTTHRGILDIDGNANAWGLFWRLASRSVVLRVMDDVPWTNYYLDKMREWEHYIPVHGNFSDLQEKVALVASSNPEDIRILERIAGNSRQATEAFTYERAVTDLVTGLMTAWLS